MILQEVMSSEEIYEDLCNKIEKLVYLPGYKISENELCKQYGVSRHIIRTAISRLKERTLLTVYPQRGTFVSLIDMKAVELICLSGSRWSRRQPDFCSLNHRRSGNGWGKP